MIQVMERKWDRFPDDFMSHLSKKEFDYLEVPAYDLRLRQFEKHTTKSPVSCSTQSGN